MAGFRDWNKANPIEIALVFLFIGFLAGPFQIPPALARWIDSPVGIAVVVILAFYMFFFTSPILAVLSLIVAYEVLRRSAKRAGKHSANTFIYGTDAALPDERTRTAEMAAMNPPQEITLEESIIDTVAPVGVSARPEKVDTAFRPMVAPVVASTL